MLDSVAPDICEVSAAGQGEDMDLVTVKLKPHNTLYSFQVTCGDAVVQAWYHLNPKQPGGGGGRGGSGAHTGQLDLPLASARVLV